MSKTRQIHKVAKENLAKENLCANLVALLDDDENDPGRKAFVDSLLMRYNDSQRCVFDIVHLLAMECERQAVKRNLKDER